ncbi:Golgi-associated plant pathogenesis-related protein 1-like [Gigantopelta aegis]|uniref:Golgi-associated plant pathogenesis-related protein 1-like n=1 Tax=Gigantopelta aegis TaxID=1735272 RepID=UPI001B88DE04|nr:Golgi-associated plant pathogenesis-related protein 1-like [Gigantopelta aegis]
MSAITLQVSTKMRLPQIKKTMADKKLIDEVLKAHNQYRALHQVPPLSHDKHLSAHAQKWANRLASADLFEHSDCRFNGKTVGENIAMKWSSRPVEYSGQEVTNEWYNEIQKYRFGNQHQPGCGHFTQVVWKGSKEMGVGMARDQKGNIIVVANYYPAGNMLGDFASNVFPPKGGSTVITKQSDNPPTERSNSKQPGFFVGLEPGIRQCGESRSVSTRTVVEGSGSNRVTKTITEERITKADGQVIVNRQEKIVTG